MDVGPFQDDTLVAYTELCVLIGRIEQMPRPWLSCTDELHLEMDFEAGNMQGFYDIASLIPPWIREEIINAWRDDLQGWHTAVTNMVNLQTNSEHE